MGKDLLVSTVRAMSVGDAKKHITSGGENLGHQLREKPETRGQIFCQWRPGHREGQPGQQINEFAEEAGVGIGLRSKEGTASTGYVTAKSLDGLYLIIGEEEENPPGSVEKAAALFLRKVFGSMK
jgi:hypothetical protein